MPSTTWLRLIPFDLTSLQVNGLVTVYVGFEEESSLKNPDPQMNRAKHVKEITFSDIVIRSRAADGQVF